jgi:hypothetical protein
VGQVGAGWSTFPVGAVVHPLHYSFPGDLRGEPGARTKRQRIDTSLDVPLVPMECPAKDRYRIMIKCPVSAITSAWFCCSQGFPQIGAKGRNLHTDARCLCSVASRSAASVQPRPTLGFRCGRRGFVVFRGPKLGTEGVSDNTTGIDQCRVDWAGGRIVRFDERR